MTKPKKNVLQYIDKRQHGFYIESDSKVPASHNNATHGYVEETATLPTKNMACDLSGQSRSTFLITFSADGRYIGSTHGDHTVRVSCVQTGRCIRTLMGHPRTPWCIAFHPHSSSVLASGCLAGEVRIWDINYGVSEVWRSSQRTVITSVAFHPCGHVILMSTANKILFWDWSKPAPFAECVTASVYEKVRWMEFDSSGHYLYTGISNTTTIQRPDADNVCYTDQSQESTGENTQDLQSRYSRIVEQITTVQRDRILHISEPDWSSPRPATEQTASTSELTAVPMESVGESEPTSEGTASDGGGNITTIPGERTESDVSGQLTNSSEWSHVNATSPAHAEALRDANDYASFVTLQSTNETADVLTMTAQRDVIATNGTDRQESEIAVPQSSLSQERHPTADVASNTSSVGTGQDVATATQPITDGDVNRNVDTTPAGTGPSSEEQTRRKALQDLIRSSEYAELVNRTAEQPVGPLSRNLLAVFSASQFLTGSVRGDVVDSFFRSRLMPPAAATTSAAEDDDDEMRSRSGSCSSNNSDSSVRSTSSSGSVSSLQQVCLRKALSVLRPVEVLPSTDGDQVCSDAISPSGSTSTPLPTTGIPSAEPPTIASTERTSDSTTDASSEDEPPPSKRAKTSSLTSMITATLMKGDDAGNGTLPLPQWSFMKNRKPPASDATTVKSSGESTTFGGLCRMTSLIESEVRLALGGSTALHQHEAQRGVQPMQNLGTAHRSGDMPSGHCGNAKRVLSSSLGADPARNALKSGVPAAAAGSSCVSKVALWPCSRSSTESASGETPVGEKAVPSNRVDISEMAVNALHGRKQTKDDILRSCVHDKRHRQETSPSQAGPSWQEVVLCKRKVEPSKQQTSQPTSSSRHEPSTSRPHTDLCRQKAWPSRRKAKPSTSTSDHDLVDQSMKQLDKKVLSIHWRFNHGGDNTQGTSIPDSSAEVSAGKETVLRVSNPDAQLPPSRLEQEIRQMRSEAARRQQESRNSTWHALQRRHLHPHYAVSILDDTINRQSDGLQASINRAIAGAFVARGEASVASNINNLTHRVQRWQLTHWDSKPNICESAANVVVPHCKLHNDASCELSSDGQLVAAFVPSHQGFPDDTILGVFSLRPDTLGQCLYTKSFGPNGISVSISPLNNYVLIGLAAKRLAWIMSPKQMVAQVYRMKTKFGGENSMELVCDLMHPCEIYEQNGVSVNSARWLPGVGQGMAYCTNRGDLHVCSPVYGDKQLKAGTEADGDVRRNLLQMLGLGRNRVSQRGTQTLLRVHQPAGTQTEHDSG